MTGAIAFAVDRRAHKRFRVLKEGRAIVAEQNRIVAATVRDLSVGGARIRVGSDHKLPDQFELLVVSEALLYPVAVRWRIADMLGLQFLGQPRPVKP